MSYVLFFSFLSFVAHLWAINTPPTGARAWRQCDTAAVARNFYDEGMDIFHPRIDARGAGDGIAGMEFPLLNLLIACTYHLFGFNHWSGRLAVLLFSLLGNVYFFLIARRFIGWRAACWAVLIWIFGPTYFYYSRNVMPDVPALAMALGSFHFYLLAEEKGYGWNGLLLALHMCLAGLIKIPYLYIVIPILAMHLRKYGFSLSKLAKPGLLVCSACMAPLA